jgi:hypothetical protein
MKHPRRVFFLIFLGIVMVNGWLYWFATTPERVARFIGEAFQSTLQVTPQITINQTVIYGQISPIAEFAVVTQEQWVEYDYRSSLTLGAHALPFTEKKINLRAPYRVKAGFDLHEPFRVRTDRSGEKVLAEMPPAKILSVERAGDLKVEGDDHWFNQITDAERQSTLNAIDHQARELAEKSTLKAEAETQVTARLKELLEKNSAVVEFRFTRP